MNTVMNTIGNNNHRFLIARNKKLAHYAGEFGTTVHFTKHVTSVYILSSFRHDASVNQFSDIKVLSSMLKSSFTM